MLEARSMTETRDRKPNNNVETEHSGTYPVHRCVRALRPHLNASVAVLRDQTPVVRERVVVRHFGPELDVSVSTSSRANKFEPLDRIYQRVSFSW